MTTTTGHGPKQRVDSEQTAPELVNDYSDNPQTLTSQPLYPLLPLRWPDHHRDTPEWVQNVRGQYFRVS